MATSDYAALDESLARRTALLREAGATLTSAARVYASMELVSSASALADLVARIRKELGE